MRGRRPQNPALGGTGRTPDGWLDEVDFLAGLEVLRDVLQGGARRPQHEAEAEAERKQAEREGQEREVAAWVRLHPQRAPEVLARDDLSPERRAEIEQILAEARSAASARATAAEREREERRERAEEEALA